MQRAEPRNPPMLNQDSSKDIREIFKKDFKYGGPASITNTMQHNTSMQDSMEMNPYGDNTFRK